MAAERSGDTAPRVAETHSGVVFFFGDRAYKVKKPVDLGFLDFRTREAREAVCHREVALNQRLAPDVYLGVSDLLDPDGTVCDHLVVMRRMPDDRRLSALVLSGAEVRPHLDDLAALLARFHAGAERGPAIDDAAGAEALTRRWSANTEGMRPFADRILDGAKIDRLDALAKRYLAGRGALFAQRVAEGRACDGHGDLLADDIFCLDDGPRVLDCLEFDDALRFDDALADVAFLAMDLERLGRPDLADHFLERYRALADDPWPASLAHHHIAYRAQVRAKVGAIRADQGVEGAAETAAALLDLAMRHLEDGVVRLVLVGGLPGTGKSTLAAGLADALDAVVLRSDVVRKERAGIDPGRSAAEAFGAGLYDAASKAATYAALRDRARVLLESGRTVVLDASWSDEGERAATRRLGEETASDVVELVCVLDADVAADRMVERARRGGDASDADASVAAALAVTFDAWPAAARIDTAAPVPAVVAVACNAVRGARPGPIRE